VVQSRAAALDEPRDGGVLAAGLHELEVHAGDVEHRLLDAVLLDVLAGDGRMPNARA
jgi:hypothetical protein